MVAVAIYVHLALIVSAIIMKKNKRKIKMTKKIKIFNKIKKTFAIVCIIIVCCMLVALLGFAFCIVIPQQIKTIPLRAWLEAGTVATAGWSVIIAFKWSLNYLFCKEE